MDATTTSAATPDGTLAAPRDLRAHLEVLEHHGKLVRVSRPIDKDTELHPLVRWQFRGLTEDKRRAFLFDHVADQRGRRFDIPVVVGALAGSDEIYALGLGCTPAQIFERWERALAAPLPPVLVDSGPVQEVVHRGDALLEHGGLD